MSLSLHPHVSRAVRGGLSSQPLRYVYPTGTEICPLRGKMQCFVRFNFSRLFLRCSHSLCLSPWVRHVDVSPFAFKEKRK